MKSLEVALRNPNGGRNIEDILSGLGVQCPRKEVAQDKGGLPVFGKSIYSQLSNVGEQKLHDSGLFWKQTGESGSTYERSFLDKEAVRAAKINAVVPENSPKIYAIIGEGVNQQGYLMELIDGYKLNDFLRAKKVAPGIADFNYTPNGADCPVEMKITVEDLLSIKNQLNCAINKLKENEIFHGDLWPPNIMVTKRDTVVKLIDPWWDAEPYAMNKCVRSDYGVLSKLNEDLTALINEIL